MNNTNTPNFDKVREAEIAKKAAEIHTNWYEKNGIPPITKYTVEKVIKITEK